MSLSRYLQRSNARIFTADWGIFNPLFALHPGSRYTELAFALESPTPTYLKELRKWFAFMPAPKLFVTHANSKLVFPQANTNLFKATAHRLRLIRTVLGRDGRPVYEVYTYLSHASAALGAVPARRGIRSRRNSDPQIASTDRTPPIRSPGGL